MKKVRPVQRFLWLVERLSLVQLLSLLVVSYLLLICFFAGIYAIGRFVEPSPTGFGDFLYFSFITQATVGYGDYHPISLGKALVMVQVLVGLIVFSLGTGAVVMRMLTPTADAIALDRHLLFYPVEHRFRIRMCNRLPFRLTLGHIEARLQYPQSTQWGERKLHLRQVPLLKDTLTRIRSMRPLLSSTFPVNRGDELSGKDKSLRPSDITPEVRVIVAVSAHYFAGTATTYKEYPYSEIQCGRFPPTYEMDGPVDWSRWDAMESVFWNHCTVCDYRAECPWRKADTNDEAGEQGPSNNGVQPTK